MVRVCSLTYMTLGIPNIIISSGQHNLPNGQNGVPVVVVGEVLGAACFYMCLSCAFLARKSASLMEMRNTPHAPS